MGMFQKITEEYGGFEILKSTIGEKELDKLCDKLYQSYCQEFEDKSYLKNVEWILRHYNSSKKITLSVLFFTQARFLYNKNSKNIAFYAMYYCLFNAFSSNIILLPYLTLDNIHKVSHGKIFSYIDNYFVKKGYYGSEVIDLLNELRMIREMYSYQLPLGSSFLQEYKKIQIDEIYERLEKLLPIVLQVSNLISYLSYYAWKKKVGKSIDEYNKYQIEVDAMFFSFIEHTDYLKKHYLIDRYDYLLQGEVVNKWKEPFPISWLIIDKMCEELEGGWEQLEDNVEGYDINEVAQYLAHTADF